MRSGSNRRLILLFLLAVLFPCTVLVIIGVRSMRQERELAEKRLADDRARSANQMRQTLLARLETLKAQELSLLPPGARFQGTIRYNDAPVRLIAEIDSRGIVLPWQRTRAYFSGGDTAVAGKLHQAAVAEFVANDPAKASATLREIESMRAAPEAAALARLSLARALTKAARATEANTEYQRVIALPLDLTDAQGVPLAFYAASRLARQDPAGVLRRIAGQLNNACCLAPEALYMLRAAIDTARAARAPDSAAIQLAQIVSRAIRETDQALALQSDFPSLGLAVPRSDRPAATRWLIYGDQPWFISMMNLARPPGNTSTARAALVAIDANGALDDVNRRLAMTSESGARLQLPAVAAQGGGSRMLNADLFDMPVNYVSTSASIGAGWRFGRTFSMALLIFVVGLTLFGAYLLWFDVRRELRLAELRSQFVSSVSHELKTPLTAIRMFAETMLLDRSRDPEHSREYLETIVNEAERLTRLLNNVLDLAKIERGQKTYQLVPVALDDLVNRCARTMEYPLAQQGFRLHLAVDEAVPRVAADEDALHQAVLNLLTNAMKYSGDSRDITLTLRRNGEAVIEVNDCGIGIPAEHIGRVAQKFYRVPTSENARIPGTGLGLTLVDHIVRAHGGRLVIESAVGRGSTIGIHLPLNSKST